MRRRWLVLILAGACGGSQPSAASGSDNRKISTLEDQLDDARNALKKERASHAQAEQAVAEANAKCAAQVAAATKAAPPPAPALPPVPPAPATQPVPVPPPGPAAPKPIAARVTEKTATGPNVRLIVGAGRNRGVAVGWSGQLFAGKTDKVVARFKITAVRENESEAIVTGTTIQGIGTNDRVELLAPAPPGAPQ